MLSLHKMMGTRERGVKGTGSDAVVMVLSSSRLRCKGTFEEKREKSVQSGLRL